MKSMASPALCSPALGREPPIDDRPNVFWTAVHSRAALASRPMLPHLAEMPPELTLTLRADEEDDEDVPDAATTGFGLGFGIGGLGFTRHG